MEEFEKMAADAYERLPDWVKAKVKNVAIIVEDVVSADTMQEMKLESNMDLLGLYTGISLVDRDYGSPFALPDTIHLYRLPIEEEAALSGEPVADVVYETIWHEIAHHFGLDEDGVEKREKEEFGG
ncbi:MAG: metallopeptidase family protein [bacterium]|nr:metallopeptidase family protein [bacterium]